jgi:hypothetical protein
MKLINKDILLDYGFVENESKSLNDNTVMTRDKIDIVIKSDGTTWYSNMGFDYPVKDVAALRKLYKEIRNIELNSIK